MPVENLPRGEVLDIGLRLADEAARASIILHGELVDSTRVALVYALPQDREGLNLRNCVLWLEARGLAQSLRPGTVRLKRLFSIEGPSA